MPLAICMNALLVSNVYHLYFEGSLFGTRCVSLIWICGIFWFHQRVQKKNCWYITYVPPGREEGGWTVGRPNFFNITHIFICSYNAMTCFVIDLEKYQKYTFQGVIHPIITIRILIRAPKLPFLVLPKTPKMGHFGYFWLFWGYQNWHFGCLNKNPRTLFNKSFPPNPHKAHWQPYSSLEKWFLATLHFLVNFGTFDRQWKICLLILYIYS